jgi:hypothetical protein
LDCLQLAAAALSHRLLALADEIGREAECEVKALPRFYDKGLKLIDDFRLVTRSFFDGRNRPYDEGFLAACDVVGVIMKKFLQQLSEALFSLRGPHVNKLASARFLQDEGLASLAVSLAEDEVREQLQQATGAAADASRRLRRLAVDLQRQRERMEKQWWHLRNGTTPGEGTPRVQRRRPKTRTR